jgi:hypothetical protein
VSNDNNKLYQPPFEGLEWDGGWWNGTITLGLNVEAGLTVTPCDPDVSRIPSEFQDEALTYLTEHWKDTLAAVLRALLPYYERMRPEVIDFLGAEADRLMPAVATVEELVALIDLRQVHIHPWLKDGIGYVGLQFGCTWDREHGLGVLLHRERVVDLGGADVSFAWAPDEADKA